MEAETKKESKEHGAPGKSPQKETESTTSLPKISGSCACGLTKWSSTNFPSRGSFCYCSFCRKLSGGAFIAFMDLPFSSVTFSPPQSSPSSVFKVGGLSRNAERGFCGGCGTTLTMRYWATKETVYLTMASVDDAFEGGVLEGLGKKHIYVGEQVDWYQVPDDGLPRFDTMPNEAKYLVFGD